MTQDQTRQLGIEFERRIQEIYPQFAAEGKLDTDTIYSFLSEYLYKYIKDLLLIEDLVENNTGVSKKIADTLKHLIRHKYCNKTIGNVASMEAATGSNVLSDADLYATFFSFPSDYFMYIRSSSILNKNYKSDTAHTNSQYVSNIPIKQKDVHLVMDNYYNHKGIMRNPMVVLESIRVDSPYIKVIHDTYTDISRLDLTYYCLPYAFNVLNFNDQDSSSGAVHSFCELPFSCFDELVSGAVDMYIRDYKFKLTSNNKQDKGGER